MTMAERDSLPHPGVRFPPPLLLVAAFLAGWFVETNWIRLHLADSPAAMRALCVIGSIALLCGVSLITWGVLTFIRARTALIPHHAASRLVQTGPYRFTRNPMYTGFTLVYVGVSLFLNAAWPLLFLPVALLALFHFVIRKEERYLTAAFGDEYTSYQRRVRRWL
jgi:protein-S-isoprenylcysteine O-methyltransferase Ste14